MSGPEGGQITDFFWTIQTVASATDEWRHAHTVIKALTMSLINILMYKIEIKNKR